LKLDIAAVIDRLSKPVDFGLKRLRVRPHKVNISNFWHPLHVSGTDAAAKFKF